MITITYDEIGTNEYKVRFYSPEPHIIIQSIFYVDTLAEVCSLIGHYCEQPHDKTICLKCRDDEEV